MPLLLNTMSFKRKSHAQHAGELELQRLRAPNQHAWLQQHLQGSHVIPAQHSLFFSQLPYLGLGSLDATGRPWATLLVTRRVTSSAEDTLEVSGVFAAGDPFALAMATLSTPRLFAGVGVDFSNRRRNKLSGYVVAAAVSHEARSIELTLVTTENLGNCPKYITVRPLRPSAREPAPPVPLGGALSDGAMAVLGRCSTAFIATVHPDPDDDADSDMGFNHRGGPPGFIRSYEDASGCHLVLPDYSGASRRWADTPPGTSATDINASGAGNQLYQSLGNVQADPRVGLVAVDFASGDALHVTGTARNLFDAAAEALMPRVSLVTVITIEDAVLIPGGIQLELSGPEQFSPYNPPLRLLASELAARGRQPAAEAGAAATLVGVKRECAGVSTFTFRLSQRADVPPAGYAVFDFSESGLAAKQYQHMNDSNPQAVNDDLVRTWTVTDQSEDRMTVCVTVKRAGRVSSLLHALPTPPPPLTVAFKGFGRGGLNCFDAPDGSPAPRRMLWLAAGVGVTPFLSLFRAMHRHGDRWRLPAGAAVTLLFSCRGDERRLVSEMAADPRIRVVLFDSTAAGSDDDHSATNSGNGPTLFRRRLADADVARACEADTVTLVCGPAAYSAAVCGWLAGAGLPPDRIRTESFEF